MTNAISDEALVTATMAGDQGAFRALYDRYRIAVLRVAQGFAEFGPDDVSEVVQESFVRAFRAMPKLRNPSRFGPWILTIARNRSLSHVYSRQTRCRTLDELARDFSRDATDDAPSLKALERAPELNAVRELIQSLPDGQEKETVRLFYVEGDLTAQQIADRQGVGKSTVTMRLERFRVKVKKALVAKVLVLRGDAPVARSGLVPPNRSSSSRLPAGRHQPAFVTT